MEKKLRLWRKKAEDEVNAWPVLLTSDPQHKLRGGVIYSSREETEHTAQTLCIFFQILTVRTKEKCFFELYKTLCPFLVQASTAETGFHCVYVSISKSLTPFFRIEKPYVCKSLQLTLHRWAFQKGMCEILALLSHFFFLQQLCICPATWQWYRDAWGMTSDLPLQE